MSVASSCEPNGGLPGIDQERSLPDQPAEQPLRPWHQLFHSSYQRHLDAQVSSLKKDRTPVLIRMDDRLTLHYQGRVLEQQVAGAKYHELKTLCHIPVALYLYLAESGTISPSELAALQHGIESLSQRVSDNELFDACRQFLGATGEAGLMSDQSLVRFRREYNRVVHRLIDEASRDAVRSMDQAVKQFEEQVNDEARWNELFCVVCSAHQPRYGELNKQYFRQYLQQRNIGDAHWEHRLIYGEGITEDDAALRLVAQRRVDERIGAVMLGSSVRLNQDILAHAARIALERHGC